jgi:hypothetical protein
LLATSALASAGHICLCTLLASAVVFVSTSYPRCWSSGAMVLSTDGCCPSRGGDDCSKAVGTPVSLPPLASRLPALT